MPGPKIDATTPHIDREGTGLVELGVISSSKQAVDAVNFYADMGITSVKVYNFITKEDLTAIIKTAHARGMKVTGHLCSITYREAVDIGIDDIEHGFFSSSDFIKDKRENFCDPFRMRRTLLDLPVDSREMKDLIAHMVKNKVALTSTINVFEPYTGREVVPGGGIDVLFPGAKEKVYKRWASSKEKIQLTMSCLINPKYGKKRFMMPEAYWLLALTLLTMEELWQDMPT